ncbi:hypothetical protein MVEN_00936100 [Mycena venus]|uniref:Uncharacterized protein n=1 Tax=Mycena venus TaxID=2733690 RepID=A0A8H6YA96_9AGAR|nr:hypothetical protein MVEN_00936100 [Mycena venus]
MQRSSIRKIRAGDSGGGESGGGESSGGESSGGESSGGESSGGESSGGESSGGGESEGGGSGGERRKWNPSGQEGESSSISSGGTTKSITTYSEGGGKATSISSGLFAGRMEGGGTRDEIWGSRTYGSGYPGSFARGVDNKGFPLLLLADILGERDSIRFECIYGQPDNSSRPGGPMTAGVFLSNSTGTTFRVVADNDTVTDLISVVGTNCSQFLSGFNSSAPPISFNETEEKPEQVVQYYRASSAALTLDGYNNTAVFAPENSTSDTSLPGGIDTNLLNCLNATIGAAVPLVDGATTLYSPTMGVLALTLLLRAVLL